MSGTPHIAGEIVQLPGWLLQDVLAWRELDARIGRAQDRHDFSFARKCRKERDEIGRRIAKGLAESVVV